MGTELCEGTTAEKADVNMLKRLNSIVKTASHLCSRCEEIRTKLNGAAPQAPTGSGAEKDREPSGFFGEANLSLDTLLAYLERSKGTLDAIPV